MDNYQNHSKLYFLAILPSKELQTRITEIKLYFKEHYKAAHALKLPPHITLAPPFSMVSSKEQRLVDDLKGFAELMDAFPIWINGFGAFKPRVIYISLEQNKVLDNLYISLNRRLAEQAYIAKDKIRKAYHPHVTLATRDLNKEIFYKAWAEFKIRSFKIKFEATEITLFRHDQKKWEILTCFPLKD